MKKFLSILSLCMVSILSLVALVSCGPDYDALLKLLMVQEGVVTEDFTVISQITREEEVYAIQWASDSECLVVASEANADNTYTISVVRPEDGQVTAHLTATIDGKASKTFEFKIAAYDVYDFSSEFQFAYDKKNVSGEIELPTSYTLKGTDKVATITWSAANEELIKIEEGKAVIPYTYAKLQTKISATFTYKGESTTKPYSVVVFDQLVYVNETELVEGQAYKLGFLQVNLENEYYFVTGEQSGNYGATTKSLEEAADFYIQAVEGGYNIYFMDGETKTYLNGKASGTSFYVNYAAEATTVWQWNEEYNTFVTDVEGTTFYMGTYSSYATLSCSKISYAPTSFVSQWYKEGVMDSNVPTYTENDKLVCEYLSYSIPTQTEGQLELITAGKKFETVAISYAVKDDGHGAIAIKDNTLIINNVKANTTVALTVTFTLGEETKTKDVEFRVKPLEAPTEILDVVTEFEADTEYYFGFNQDSLGATYFFTGAMNGYYGATSKISAEGVKVKATAVEGGYNLSFVDKDGNTCYISAVASGEHLNFVFNAETPSTWTWNAEYNTFVTMVGDKEVFMGTYGTYNTMSISTTDKLATNFPAHFYDLTQITDEIMVSESVKELENKLQLGLLSDPTIVRLVTLYDVTVEVTLPEGTETMVWDSEYNVLTITPVTVATTTEVVVVKVTKGESTQSFEVEVKTTTSKEPPLISIAEALEIGGTYDKNAYSVEKYRLTGTVTEIQSTKYGNLVITDGTNSILIYGLYDLEGNRYDAMAVAPQVGDVITVETVLGKYNEPQGKNATLIWHNVVSIAKALEIGGSYEKNTYSTEKYKLTGTVKEIQNATYGNIVITDGTNDILLYGLYDLEGNRYDKMETKPQVGDVITVETVLGKYSAPQGKNATLVSLTTKAEQEEENSSLKAELKYTGSSTLNMDGTNEAAKLGLDENLFSVEGIKNTPTNNIGLNKDGSVRLYNSSSDGNGNELKITGKGVKILKIVVAYGTKVNSFTVNGNAGSKDVTEYEINASEVIIKNTSTGSSQQVHFTSITIYYEVTE